MFSEEAWHNRWPHNKLLQGSGDPDSFSAAVPTFQQKIPLSFLLDSIICGIVLLDSRAL